MCFSQLVQNARVQPPGSPYRGLQASIDAIRAAGSQYVPGTIPLVPVKAPTAGDAGASGTGTGPITITPEQKSRQGSTLLGGGRKSLLGAGPRRRTLLGGYGGGG